MKLVQAIGAAICALLISGGALALKDGDTVPALARVDVNGKAVRIPNPQSKIILLNFWATWCEPCREEMPKFSQWQKTFGKELQVVGVSMDDDVAAVKKFIQRYPVTYPIVMGDAKLAEQYGGVLGLPLSYLLDGEGRVLARYQGEVDLPKMEATIRSLLTKKGNREIR